jgi:hypothetical protein
VGGEHDGPVDRTDDVGNGRGIRGEAARRVGGGDHRVSGVEQRIDDGVQGYLADWLSQSSKWVGAMRASSPGVRDPSSTLAPK